MLFHKYIDDLAKLLQRYGITVRLFADDAKVYLEITGHEDVVLLALIMKGQHLINIMIVM